MLNLLGLKILKFYSELYQKYDLCIWLRHTEILSILIWGSALVKVAFIRSSSIRGNKNRVVAYILLEKVAIEGHTQTQYNIMRFG